MKVLSLYQPWASLIALGAKTIETRGHPAPKSLIGQQIAIHAAKRNPVRLSRLPEGMMGRYTVHQDGRGEPCYLLDSDWWKTTDAFQYPIPLPLGAIVATCTLADCIPMVDARNRALHNPPRCLCVSDNILTLWTSILTLWTSNHGTSGEMSCIEDQRPYGDFQPGRFAWLLVDIKPLPEPVAFKGGQGLSKSWEPAA